MDTKDMFKTKKTSDILEPSWFAGIKGYSSDTLEDGTIKEYCMYNLFCDIYKFEKSVMPIFKKDSMRIHQHFFDKMKDAVDAIREDSEDPNQTEEFFNFARCGFIIPKAWEEGVWNEGDDLVFFLDLMEITDTELRKIRTDDEIDRNVYFYYSMDPMANYKTFTDPSFGEKELEKLGWTNLIDTLLDETDLGPVKNMNAAEIVKMKRYNKISGIKQLITEDELVETV